MLYPHNKESVLSDELFRNPGSEYRGTPFWAWNCKLEKDELLRQLDVLKKMGFGGAHMHVRTGMATPYLSDEYMELIRSCVEKCRDEKMLAWLYDEDRWPSGAAGGIVTKDIRYRARYLMLTPFPYSNNGYHKETFHTCGRAERSEKGYLLACYDIVLDENGCLRSGIRIAPDQDAVGTKWYVYVETPNENPWYNNQTYVNTLDKAAIRRFIEVTYERYLETIGQDFGGVVPAIFTDEPQFVHKQSLGFAREQKDVVLPWTDDIPETFQETYGEDILEYLPQLLWELPGGKVSTIRYHYHDHICERFTQSFADQCGTWCGEHGLMLTGHMMEEPTLRSQTAALGEAMRSYRSFQLPGIDMLGNSFEFTTAKQAQSASRQYGREGVLSELYGVTGWDFDFRGHKIQGDWQAALGVTVRVPHLSWVSMKGEAKRDYPASINYQSPWWEDYSYVENHFARVNTAMTRGKPQVRVGVIHPVESYWLHFGPEEQTNDIRSQLDENFSNVTKWLLCGNIDFDFISESLLPELCPEAGNPLQVGQMRYDAVIVPGCETLRSTTLSRLKAFREAGGKLIFLGQPPRYADAIPSPLGQMLWQDSVCVEFTRNALLESLEDLRQVDIRNQTGVRTSNLIHQLRSDGEDLWLFIAHSEMPYNNDIPNVQDLRIALDGSFSALKYDTISGEILPLESIHSCGKTMVTVRLYDMDSLLLRFTPHQQSQVSAEETRCSPSRAVSLPALVPYTLSEPNAYVLDKAEFALEGSPWQPAQELLRVDNEIRKALGMPSRQAEVAQPWTVKDTPPVNTVHLRFRIHCACPIPNVHIALEDADKVTVSLNANTVTARPDGWYTDKSIGVLPLGDLQAGENTIQVDLPFGPRTNIEWCYLLGHFGVRVLGEYRELIPAQEALAFDNIVHQGLAHYCGNITYHTKVQTNGGDLLISIPHYAGAGIRVEINGSSQHVVYPPYETRITGLPAGEYALDFVLLGNRHNGFGPIHMADCRRFCIGPDAWRTTGSGWTESYRLRPVGILSAPVIKELID